MGDYEFTGLINRMFSVKDGCSTIEDLIKNAPKYVTGPEIVKYHLIAPQDDAEKKEETDPAGRKYNVIVKASDFTSAYDYLIYDVGIHIVLDKLQKQSASSQQDNP